MNKFDLAGYMANLLSIHDYYEDMGIEHHTIEAELQGLHEKLEDALKDEHPKARTEGEQGNERRESGTVVPSRQPRSEGPTGSGFKLKEKKE